MIFGTDGIRARVGQHPLDEENIQKLSLTIAEWLALGDLVVLGSDTRASCETVKDWITSYLHSYPIEDLGVVPTPVVAFETQARGARLGIMITASHNPPRDNGLKFFDTNGLKIKYELARAWSKRVEGQTVLPRRERSKPRQSRASAYRRFVLEHFKPEDFKGLKLGFDLANGAGAYLVADLVRELRIDAVFHGADPDGQNINERVGALHPEALAGIVAERGLDAGFCLDGDGDRLSVVAPEPLHGDVVLYALYLILRKEHPVEAVVGTIMCGLGLEQQLKAEGLSLIRTQVGDQNVLAKLVAKGLLLGGEPSGHLIQADLFPAGDGFLAALRIAKGLRSDPDLLNAAKAAIPMYPVFEKAYAVRHKPSLESVSSLDAKVNSLKGQLSADSRLILRYSGTEPKLRLFLETPDLDSFQADLAELEQIIARELT